MANEITFDKLPQAVGGLSDRAGGANPQNCGGIATTDRYRQASHCRD